MKVGKYLKCTQIWVIISLLRNHTKEFLYYEGVYVIAFVFGAELVFPFYFILVLIEGKLQIKKIHPCPEQI